jgi:hypothetical protein
VLPGATFICWVQQIILEEGGGGGATGHMMYRCVGIDEMKGMAQGVHPVAWCDQTGQPRQGSQCTRGMLIGHTRAA